MMLSLLNRLLNARTNAIPCGGEIRFDILDMSNRLIASIWLLRPDSAMKLNFVYETQNGLSSESNLRELQNTPKEDKAKKCHEIMWRDLCIPFARKLFVRSNGFNDENGKPLSILPKENQLQVIEKWYTNVLVDAVLYAFNDGLHVKKK